MLDLRPRSHFCPVGERDLANNMPERFACGPDYVHFLFFLFF